MKINRELISSFFTTKGRITISEYMLSLAMSWLYYFIVAQISGGYFKMNESSEVFLGFIMITSVIFIFSLIVSTSKRFHDTGRSGSNIFGFIIPIYNLYLLYKLFLSEGDSKDNKYGGEPREYPLRHDRIQIKLYGTVTLLIIFIVLKLVFN